LALLAVRDAAAEIAVVPRAAVVVGVVAVEWLARFKARRPTGEDRCGF